MKSIRCRLLIATMAVLLGSAVAKSQTSDDAAPTTPMQGHRMHEHGFGMEGHMMGFMAQKLNLTDDQKTQMKAIMEKERPTMKPLHQQERQIEQQLRQYVEGTFDQAKVAALATQKAQIQAQLTVQETRIHNEMYQLLTAEQKDKLKQMETEHESRMQQRMNQQAPAAPEQ